MEYMDLFKHYYLEGLNEIITPSKWMNMVPSFFNVNRTESLFFYVFIMLVKNVIVFHGMMHILPMWVSLTCLPALRVYSHYLIASEKVITSGFTTEKFGLLWAMLWQCVPNVTAKYWFYSFVFTIIDLSQEFYEYTGLQITLDMYIVVIVIWYMVRSLVNLELDVIFLFIVGGMFYTNLGFGWKTSPYFYIILYILLTTILCLYGLFLVFDSEKDEVYRLYMSVLTGVAIIMISIMVSVTYLDYFQAKQPGSCDHQPDPPVMDYIKEYYNLMEAILNVTNVPEEHQDLIDATREALASRKARKIDKSVSLDPKLKSIIFTPNDDGPPDFMAGTQVKYWTNETVPSMLF